MPSMADITVKKADGATSIVWSALTASGGDTSPAVWRSNTAIGNSGQKPVLKLLTKDSSDKSVRRCQIDASFPEVYTETTTGLLKVIGKCSHSGTWAVPQNLSATTVFEFSAQLANLIASQLIVASIATGYAPT